MGSDFNAALARLGLTRRAFARAQAALANRPPQYRTVEAWGPKREPPDAAWALLALMKRNPEEWQRFNLRRRNGSSATTAKSLPQD